MCIYDEHCTTHPMSALHVHDQLWGEAGSTVIAVKGGALHPAVARALKAYDSHRKRSRTPCRSIASEQDKSEPRRARKHASRGPRREHETSHFRIRPTIVRGLRLGGGSRARSIAS